MKFILLIIALTSFQQSSAGLISETDSLNQYIQHLMEAENIPGISIAIIEPNGEIRFKNFGHADLDQQKPVDEHTIFEIGSITKTFTAGLIHILLEDSGKSPTDEYYNETDINIHHILTHYSGLPRLPDNLLPVNPADPYREYTDSLMYEFLDGVELTHAPGEQFAYSNLGYMLLGDLTKVMSGKTYDELVNKYITDKLGMNSTTRLLADSSRFATPSADGLETHEWNFDGVKGVGGFRSTASDMTKYLKMLMQKTEYKYLDIFQETFAPENRKKIDDKLAVAHSWFIDSKYEDEIIFHNGDTGGFSSFIGFSSVSGKGVIILSNANHSIVDIGLHTINPEHPLQEITEYLQLEASQLEKLSGTYQSDNLPDFTIFHNDQQLYGQMTGQQPLPLNPISDTEFENETVQARITFKIIDAEQAHSLVLHQGGQSFPFERKQKSEPGESSQEIEHSQGKLTEFSGTYSTPEGMELTIQLQDGALTARLTGQDAFNIYPKGQNTFFFRVVDAELHFSRNENQEIKQVALHQSGQKILFNRKK